ncbi:hypothetical protein [Aeromonas rivuli]|uniref:hypothetical protein n=1 Tax=Aeromonas rivuli TaxID=648794 RepID=UPI0029620C75|nr:hypothetical protein [Aeromonas rivuli]UBO75413.1 hypothetical protein KYK33_07790 [Aeromonas rivuli]
MMMRAVLRPLAVLSLVALLGACTSPAPKPAVVAPKPVQASQPVVAAPDPDAVVQSDAASPTPVFDEQYHGPDQGSLESVTALFARGYLESALRETMLAAVQTDYPLLGMRDVRMSDPVSKFLGSAKASGLANDYLRAGVERRLGHPLSAGQWQQIWQGLPKQGRVSDWSLQLKRVLAGR